MAYNPDLLAYKLTMADLKVEVPIDDRTFLLLGGDVINDNINGLFRYEDSSTATPDDIDVIKPDSILLANPGRYIRQKIGGAVIARGTFFNNSDISFTSGVPIAIPMDNNLILSTYISHNTVTNNSRIIANKEGFILLAVSPQILKGGAGSGSMYFYLKKNGSLVANSGFRIDCSNNDTQLPFFTMSASMAATDYLEVWAETTSANFSLDFTAAAGTVPNVPSFIVNAFLYNNFPS